MAAPVSGQSAKYLIRFNLSTDLQFAVRQASMMSVTSAIAPWDLSETLRLLDNPAVRLLRSPNAALTLTFLHRAFKEHHAISVPESHLRARLENFLEEPRNLVRRGPAPPQETI
jgi:hypothetical protein